MVIKPRHGVALVGVNPLQSSGGGWERVLSRVKLPWVLAPPPAESTPTTAPATLEGPAGGSGDPIQHPSAQ